MVSKTRSSYVPWSQERTVAIVERHRAERGALMPILHELQDVFGHIDPRAVDLVAEELNLSKAEVYGVVTFYKDFRSEPPGSLGDPRVPRGSLPVHGCRAARPARPGAPGRRLRRHDVRRRGDPRAGVLSRQLRALPGGACRRPAEGQGRRGPLRRARRRLPGPRRADGTCRRLRASRRRRTLGRRRRRRDRDRAGGGRPPT